MTRVSELGLSDIDPTEPAFYARPDYFDVLAVLRADAPVHRVAEGLVTVARYQDIREVSRDPARFRSSGGALVNDPIRTGSPTGNAPSILFLDPPEHVRNRGLVNRRFTPRAVSAMEVRVRQLAQTVFDRLPDTSEPIDVVDHLTAPFPLLVIAELLGIPDGDRADFRRWSDAAIESTDRPPAETMAAIMEMHAFLTAHLEAKQRDPGDDIVSLLGRAEIDGRRLTPDEVFIWLLTLLVAGNETTRTLLTGAMVALAEHPDQRAALAVNPDGIPAAVEECLRWVTPIQTFCRTVVADTTVGGRPGTRRRLPGHALRIGQPRRGGLRPDRRVVRRHQAREPGPPRVRLRRAPLPGGCARAARGAGVLRGAAGTLPHLSAGRGARTRSVHAGGGHPPSARRPGRLSDRWCRSEVGRIRRSHR